MNEMKKHELEIPTKGEARSKRQLLEDARSFQHSVKSVQEMVENKRKVGTAPTNYGTSRQYFLEKKEKKKKGERMKKRKIGRKERRKEGR